MREQRDGLTIFTSCKRNKAEQASKQTNKPSSFFSRNTMTSTVASVQQGGEEPASVVPSTITPSLYARMGGDVAVCLAIGNFFEQIGNDPDLQPYFENISISALQVSELDSNDMDVRKLELPPSLLTGNNNAAPSSHHRYTS